jgi:fructose transport system substrate-binding protein
MVRLGVTAAIDHIRNHVEPVNSKGVDFVNTGVTLVADNPVGDIKSIDSKKGAELCWRR